MNKQMPINTRDPVNNPAAMPDAFYRNAPVSWKGYSGGEKCVVDKVGGEGRVDLCGVVGGCCRGGSRDLARATQCLLL